MNWKSAHESVRLAGIVQFGVAAFPMFYNLKAFAFKPTFFATPVDFLIGLVIGIYILRNSFLASLLALALFLTAVTINVGLLDWTLPWIVTIVTGLIFTNGCRAAFWLTRHHSDQDAISGHTVAQTLEPARVCKNLDFNRVAILAGIFASVMSGITFTIVYVQSNLFTALGMCGFTAPIGYLAALAICPILKILLVHRQLSARYASLLAGLLASLATGAALFAAALLVLGAGIGNPQDSLIRLALTVILPCILTGIAVSIAESPVTSTN
jgi:hypothetical protein